MALAVVFNLGCKVNQYECDALLSGLKEKGYDISSKLEKADVYIVNTCAVTAEAERKSRQILQRIRRLNPNATIKIIGCASQKSYDFYIKNGIEYVGGTGGKLKALDDIKTINTFQNDKALPFSYEEIGFTPLTDRTRSFIKIQDGCDNSCSYCIIPSLRGSARSRSIENILNEVKIVASATKEIVFTGINLSFFGKENNQTLTELMIKLKDIEVRVRLGSLYMEIIDKELLDALFALKQFCPHFHLSLQHGEDGVLRDMNRRYTTDEYFEKLDLIRSYDKNAAITTDIIVGYPTETQERFEKMMAFVEKCAFSDIHIFTFSAREGTAAYKLKQIEPNIVAKRRKRLEDLKKKLRDNYLVWQIGRVQNVLIENDDYSGYSRYYTRIYSSTQALSDNEVSIVPQKPYKDGLIGDIVKETLINRKV